MKEFYGVVKERRIFKWGGFFLLETFSGIYQCVIQNYDLSSLKSESYIKIVGEEKAATIKKEMVVRDKEILVNKIEILSEPVEEIPFNIYEKELNASIENILNCRQVSLRNEHIKSVFKIQAAILNLFRNYLNEQGFTSICSPKIVANGAEGGTNVFRFEYFGKEAYLAQSPQFYKQITAGVFGKVYETAPVFRAEKHNTSRHINEYTSLDVEMILRNSFYELIELEKNLLNSIFNSLSQNTEIINYLGVELPTVENISNSLILKVSDIKNILGTSVADYDLNGEEEIEIGKYAKENHNTDFVFATHYHRETRPFYTKLSKNGIETESFDLLYKGMEITSGGQRKESYQEYINAMNEKGMNISSFQSYLDTFKYGMPLHGGFAIGLERITAKLCGIQNIKLATLFPRDVDRLIP